MPYKETKNTRQKILEGAFDYLIKNGLENASIRNICNHTGLAKGTITHHFYKKEDLLCSAAEYGLQKMSDDIFAYFFDNIYNIESFFGKITENIGYVINELRFIYQMVASPVYGERLRKNSGRFIYAYNEYAQRLANETGGDVNVIKPIICIFAACVIDYVLWQDEDEVQMQLDFICMQLKQVIKQKGE